MNRGRNGEILPTMVQPLSPSPAPLHGLIGDDLEEIGTLQPPPQQHLQQQQQPPAHLPPPTDPQPTTSAADAAAVVPQEVAAAVPRRTLYQPQLPVTEKWNPEDYGLSRHFKLTRYTNLKQQNNRQQIGIGLDSCVIPLRFGNMHLVQTTDFFYPLVDDPYMMGRIAAANVLSDLYAMGVADCDNMLMLLGVAQDMSEDERDTVIPIIIQGFRDTAKEAGCMVEGGQTVKNPWLTLGGVATAVTQHFEFIMPTGAVPGDVLVLTKPLGTQVAVNAFEWMEDRLKWKKIADCVTREEVEKAYYRAMDSMARLNRNAARLMHKYTAHAATDVTGFGLLGHARNLASSQTNEVSFVIHNLPIILKMERVAKAIGNMFGLMQGTSAETSGGLLVALPREQAASFCKDMERSAGHPAWIIGVVERGNRSARIIDRPRVISVPAQDKPDQLW